VFRLVFWTKIGQIILCDCAVIYLNILAARIPWLYRNRAYILTAFRCTSMTLSRLLQIGVMFWPVQVADHAANLRFKSSESHGMCMAFFLWRAQVRALLLTLKTTLRVFLSPFSPPFNTIYHVHVKIYQILEWTWKQEMHLLEPMHCQEPSRDGSYSQQGKLSWGTSALAVLGYSDSKNATNVWHFWLVTPITRDLAQPLPQLCRQSCSPGS
jgi:hypothetical protein